MLTRRWAGINELGRALKIDPAAVSRRVARLEARGEIETREGPRRAKLVDLAEYGRATGIDFESFCALPTMIEQLAHRGQLGDGVERDRRMATVKRYCDALLRSSHDVDAAKTIEKVDTALGYIDRDLVRAILIDNQSPSEISKLRGYPSGHLIARIRGALDLVAGIV